MSGGAVRAAIVVAGGRSTRFGGDKLRHRIDGRTLLERTVAAARACGTVVVVGAADAPPGADVAVSEFPRHAGPCAAIGAGVDAVRGMCGDADVLILAADLADPVTAVSALLARAPGVLADADGRPQWLLARIPLAELRDVIGEQLRERPTLAGLPASTLFARVEARHPVADRILADIDTPADLPAAQAGQRHAEELIHGTV